MTQEAELPRLRDQWLLFYFVLFLAFFWLVSDFIESVYAFGLLGTDIPPEIVMVLAFFSPLALFFNRGGLSRRNIIVLTLIAVALFWMGTVSTTRVRLMTDAIGAGMLFVALAALFPHLSRWGEDGGAVLLGAALAGAAAVLALDGAIIQVSGGVGTKAVWTALLLFQAIDLWKDGAAPEADQTGRAPFSAVAVLCVGIAASLAVLYFAFENPVVISRWSTLDPLLVFGLLLAASVLGLAALKTVGLNRLSKWILPANALFLLAGTVGILMNQVQFPRESGAYPFDQPGLALGQQIPLMLMILLSPVIILNVVFLTRALLCRRPSAFQMAGGFTLGMFFMLLVVFAQVFTTVYDYIPVVGPLFRDKFWLSFLLAGLGMALPLLAASREGPLEPQPDLRILLALPALLLIALGWYAINRAQPAMTENGTLRVVSYNIQQGYTSTGERGYYAQLEKLREFRADIIGLQETDTARFAGGNADIVGRFANDLKLHAYYGPRTVTGTFGVALLSRYPIREPRTFFMYSEGEQTAAIEAKIVVNGVTYTVLVTHLGNGGPVIQQQQVLERLAGKPNVIAMGDFNFALDSQQYQLTRQTLDDAWVLAGSGVQQGGIMHRLIDHIFVSPGMKASDGFYDPSAASDHPALVVELVR